MLPLLARRRRPLSADARGQLPPPHPPRPAATGNTFSPPPKEGDYACLSVCLSIRKITQKVMNGFR